MSRESVALALTFVLACASATFFLLMRCEGRGRAFGPRSRRWAVLVIAATSLLSAVGAAALAELGRYVPAVILSLGIAAPGSLCLGRTREGIPERRTVYSAAPTLWLGWLLARMTDGMAEDKLEWCEERVDAAWHCDQLILAAHFYHDYLNERLRPKTANAIEFARFCRTWKRGSISLCSSKPAARAARSSAPSTRPASAGNPATSGTSTTSPAWRAGWSTTRGAHWNAWSRRRT